MNWMTSAKNRFQRSNKSKSDNSLRMAASSKLPASRVRNSIVLHNFQQIPSRQEGRGVASRMQSNDVWMLNNRSREQYDTTKQANTQQDFQPEPTVGHRQTVASDPLRHLEITPPKKWCQDAEELIEEQQITYYNDGHLCDELGNLVIDVSSNHASPGTRIAPKRRLFSPVRERTPLQIGEGSGAGQGGGDVRESPELRLDSADGDDWWCRLLSMVDSGGMSATHLNTVLAELSTTIGTACTTLPTTEQLAQVETPPSAREALNALYRALSKVGRDTRASLTVFDAIRMLELVDKQHSDHTLSHTGGGLGTASTIRTTNTTAHQPILPTQTVHLAHFTQSEHRATNANRVHANDSDWNLFDTPISTTITINTSKANSRQPTNTTGATNTMSTTISAKRKLSPTYGSTHNNSKQSTYANTSSTYSSGADMELRLEDLF